MSGVGVAVFVVSGAPALAWSSSFCQVTECVILFFLFCVVIVWVQGWEEKAPSLSHANLALDDPVVLKVPRVVGVVKGGLQERAHVRVVGRGVVREAARVLDERGELRRCAGTQDRDGRRRLERKHALLLALARRRGRAVAQRPCPRQRAVQHEQQHVSHRLHIVSTALSCLGWGHGLWHLMCVLWEMDTNGHRCARQCSSSAMCRPWPHRLQRARASSCPCRCQSMSVQK